MIQTLTLVQQDGQVLVQNPRRRRLGSLFIPQRRGYVIVMPTILLAGALICWATGSDLSLITGACILSAISFYLAFDLLGRRGPLRVSTLLAMTLGLGYGLGTANTWFTLPRGDNTLGDFLHIDTRELSYAMASVLIAVALMLAVGELYEKPIFGQEFLLSFNNRAMLFLTIGTGVFIGSYLHGSTGFMGATVNVTGDEAGHVGILGSAVSWLSGALLATSVCAALNVKGIFMRNYARVLSILLFGLALPLGRRVLIYSVVLALVGLRLGRYKVPYSPLKKTVLLAIMGGVVYFATIGFFYLRVAGYSSATLPTLMERIQGAIHLSQTTSYAEIKAEFAQNVERRTFILGFLAQLEAYTEVMPGGHGIDLLKQTELAVPSLIAPGKDRFFTEEALADQLFGADYGDEANSVFTAGAVDFGFWGVVFYPLIAVFVVRFFFEGVAEIMPPFAACFVILAACSELLEPENTVTAYITIMRNGLLFGSIVWIIMAAPEFRLRREGV